MKHSVIAIVVLFLGGCSASNWNILANDLSQHQAVSTTSKSYKSPPQAAPSEPISYAVDEPSQTNDDFVMVEEDLSTHEKTTTRINANKSQIKETATNLQGEVSQNKQNLSDQTQEKAQKIKDEVTTTTNTKSQYHIDKIIEIWGEPSAKSTDAKGNKIYSWKNCKATGMFEKQCDTNGNCEKVARTSCCDRKLRTDKGGYVQNLKEAIAACK